jgi:hypothetical protein
MGVSIMPLQENFRSIDIPYEEIITPEEARRKGLIKETQIQTLPEEPTGLRKVLMEMGFKIPEKMSKEEWSGLKGILTKIGFKLPEAPPEAAVKEKAITPPLSRETVDYFSRYIPPTATKEAKAKVEKREVRPSEPKPKEKAALETVADENIKTLLKEEETYGSIVKTANEELKKSREKYFSKIDELSKKIDEWGNKLDPLYQKISEELNKPLPKPPTEEEITEPKQPILALFKDLTPVIVGLTALLRPGKYGENLFYFNSMYQAIRDSDDRKFKESLDKWQRELQIGLAEKNNKINALKTLADSIKGKIDILGTTGQLALKGIESEVKGWEDQIKNADKMIDGINKAIEKIQTELYKQKQLELQEEKIGIEKGKLVIEAAKAGEPKSPEFKYIEDLERRLGRKLSSKEREEELKRWGERRKFGFGIGLETPKTGGGISGIIEE